MGSMEAVTATMENISWIDVCTASELIDNIGVCALINQRQVAIFRLSGSGSIYAIENHDPFSDANVLARGVVGDLKGQPVVASPIFKHHFDLRTGQCLEDASVKLEVFPIRLVEGTVQVGIL